jgi:hypothetical protein
VKQITLSDFFAGASVRLSSAAQRWSGSNRSMSLRRESVTDVSGTICYRHVRAGQNVGVRGGVHFRTGLDVAADMGRKVAAPLLETALKPAR